jgi:rare lipoprotein A
MYAMTAAHKTLPLPSYVLVTNVENQKQIVVRVNDRGPFKEGRIIDLSYAAAHKLEMHEKGTAQVHIQTLPPFLEKPEFGEPVKSKAVLSEIDFPEDKTNYLQVGVYSNEQTAKDLQLSLVKHVDNNVLIIKDRVKGDTLHKVRVGPISNFEELEKTQLALIEQNLSHFYLISE